MGMLSRNTTPPFSTDTRSIVKKWMLVLCEMYPRELSDAFLAIWIEGTKNIEPAKLEGAFRKLVATFIPTSACPFPVFAQLGQCFDDERQAIDFAEIEKSWKLVLGWLNWEWAARDHKWTAQEKFAIGAAGGFDAIGEMDAEATQWAKKRFVEGWQHWKNMPEENKALPSPEVAALLEEHYKKAETRYLTGETSPATAPRPRSAARVIPQPKSEAEEEAERARQLEEFDRQFPGVRKTSSGNADGAS